jgi:uncharacterized protein (DUF2147 family)
VREPRGHENLRGITDAPTIAPMRFPPLLPALLAVAIGLLPTFTAAEPAPIEGRWITFDDTNQKRAVIEIVREGRLATGRIVELFLKPGEDPDPVCENCPGAFRGRRIRGLVILAVEAEENGMSYRGTVLDPEEGSNYRCVVTLLPDGKRLRLRGFVALEIFGRSEVWVRPD